jgi:hypothetical protein
MTLDQIKESVKDLAEIIEVFDDPETMSLRDRKYLIRHNGCGHTARISHAGLLRKARESDLRCRKCPKPQRQVRGPQSLSGLHTPTSRVYNCRPWPNPRSGPTPGDDRWTP